MNPLKHSLRISLLTSCILLFFSTIAFSQSPQPPNWNDLTKTSKAEWEINDAQYQANNTEAKEDWALQVIQVSDGGYVVAGFSHEFSGGSYISKFNANGNKVWCYDVPNDDGGAFVDVTEVDNHFIALGYSKILKIEKNGNPSTAQVLKINNSALDCVKKSPDGVIITGSISDGNNQGLFVASIAVNNINISNSPVTISNTSNGLFNWVSFVGKANILLGTTNTNILNNVAQQHLATDDWPLFPNSVIGYAKIDESYENFAGNWLAVEDLGGGDYDVFVTGGANWRTFIKTVNGIPLFDENNPTVVTSTATKSATIAPRDVLALKINKNNASIAGSNVKSVSWIKTYNKVPETASINPANSYMQYYSDKTPRRPQSLNATGLMAQFPPLNSVQATQLAKYENCFFNTMENFGSYIDVSKTNNSKLIIGGTYNFAHPPQWNTPIWTYGDHDYYDADAAAFIIDKSTGALLSSKPKLIAHNSGHDFKIRMAQNDLGDIFTVGTSSDVIPVRKYASVAEEDYITSKLRVNNTTNEVDIHWVRDIFTEGNEDPSITHAHGICGFGIGITMDNGYIMCGNNNQQSVASQANFHHSDDITIVKMSPDCEINDTYSATFEPFNVPMVYSSGVTTINTDKTIGRHIVVKNNAELRVENCTLKFANSQWIYDYEALIENNPTTDPDFGGMVGITVEKGGKLTLNNCTLTGMKSSCSNDVGNMWDGVVVEGDPALGWSAAQGTIEMDNATIEDAYVGITLDGRGYSLQKSPNLFSYKTGYCPLYSDPSGPQLGYAYLKRPHNGSYHGKGGGRVIATNSHFINNSSKHVEFMWSDKFPNYSSFTNTEFTANTHAPELIRIDDDGDWRGTDAFVTIWANHGIRFKGCDFNGYTVQHVDPLNTITLPQIYKNGAGIVSLNSEFTVTGHCTNPYSIPCSDYIRSHFRNLRMGISAAPSFGQPATKYLNINNTEFGMFANGSIENLPNLENIFVNGGGRNVQIHNNYINVADVEETDPSQWGNPQFYPYGIHLQGTDGFLVEENLVKGGNGVAIAFNNDYGIVINDAGENNNRVYKNEVANLEHALVSLHINWNSNTGDGLDWMCNNLSSLSTNGIEVMSASDIISYNTAYSNNQPNWQSLWNSNHAFFQGDFDYPANNIFDYACNSNIEKLENDPTTFGYYYFYDATSLSAMNPNPCVNPTINTQQTSTNPNTCESHFNNGTIKYAEKNLDYAAIAQGIQAQEMFITNILDDASSNNLMGYINDPTVSNNLLEQYLTSAGPYLSEDILQAVIERPSAPLSDAQLSQIILDNSPLSDEVYDELDDERPLLAGNNTIVMAQYEELSPRQKLQVRLRTLRANKRTLCLTAAHYYMHLPTPNPSQAANLFLASGLPMDAVPFMIQAQDYSNANILLSNFTAVSEGQIDEKNYLQMCVNGAMTNSNMQELVLANVTMLESMATHHTSTAYTAQNLLAQYNDAPLPHAIKPLMGTAGANKTSNEKRKYTVTNYLNFFEENTATLFPNPARDKVILKTHLVDDAKELNVEIYTLVGQRVKGVQSKATSGNSNIELGSLPMGNYLVKVIVDGEVILNTKLAVIQ